LTNATLSDAINGRLNTSGDIRLSREYRSRKFISSNGLTTVKI